MPAGTSWPRYIAGATGALLSMFAGSQTIHIIYQPLRDLDDRVEMEKQKLRMANAELTALSSDSNSSSQTASSPTTSYAS